MLGGMACPRRARPNSTRLIAATDRVYALAIYFMHYNFVRIHQTTRVTPAIAAGVTDTLWEIEDIARLTG